MSFRRRQILGWAVLLAFALMGGGWLLRLDYAEKISNDVLDLIPVDERAPELTLVRSLASQAEARVMLIVLTNAGGKAVPPGADSRFAAELAHSPAFSQAVALGDSTFRDAIGKEVFEQRFALLFPRWLQEKKIAYGATGGSPEGFSGWLAHDVAGELSRFLSTPEALAFQEIVPADPLLLMPRVADRFKNSPVIGQPAGAPALVWASLADSPLSEAGQAPAFAAINQALATLQAEYPGLKVSYTGINRFAAASRERIEHEVTWLNALSLLSVLAVASVFIPRVYRGLHLVPVVMLSILGAWVCVTLAFHRVHILVFVVGSLLTGVAIDYGFYLYMQPPQRPDEDYWAKVRRLLKPLLASCLTTVAGFALLTFSELPLIRQLGVFVGTGLVCALVAAVIYFSTVRNSFLPTRVFPGGRLFTPRTRIWIRRALTGLGLIALVGLVRLSWRDDIRELEIPSKELKENDARVRQLFGESEERTVYITYGESAAEARGSLEKFERWLGENSGGHATTTGLDALVPTVQERNQAATFVREQQEFPVQLRTALAAGGFDESGFAPFFDAYARYAAEADKVEFDALVASLQKKLTGPTGLLVHAGRPLSWFVTLVSNAPAVPPPAEIHTVSASQLQTLNRIFSHYRQSALKLSLVGLALVGAGVFFTYGFRDGMRIFAIPCGAAVGVFGFFGWWGQPLNLFHLLGAFLGICLTHNYSIFSATSAYRGESTPVSVRLSALTAAASFGVLALSGIPVVHALGSTVALMVIVALLMIEFEHLAALKDQP